MKRGAWKLSTAMVLVGSLACSEKPAASQAVQAAPGKQLTGLAPAPQALRPEPAVRRSSGDSRETFSATTSAQLEGSPLVLPNPAPLRALAEPVDEAPRTPDVIYVPTPQPVVNKMLEMARLRPGQVVYDLGCGDGRIVVTAAKRYGVRAYGFDIDPDRVAEARENAKRNGVEHLVTIEQQDIFQLDLSPADVVTLYLLPELNVKLIPQLRKLKDGARIVSHDFAMEPIEPDEVVEVAYAGREHLVYLWTSPLKE